MATEAFALSPMSARAAEPNEQDYDAIREAFMETARGRWFLGEYAKRNRNADTAHGARCGRENRGNPCGTATTRRRGPPARGAGRDPPRHPGGRDHRDRGRSTRRRSRRASRRSRAASASSRRSRGAGARSAPTGESATSIDSQLSAIEAACAQVSTIDPRASAQGRIRSLEGPGRPDRRGRRRSAAGGGAALPGAGAGGAAVRRGSSARGGRACRDGERTTRGFCGGAAEIAAAPEPEVAVEVDRRR